MGTNCSKCVMGENENEIYNEKYEKNNLNNRKIKNPSQFNSLNTEKYKNNLTQIIYIQYYLRKYLKKIRKSYQNHLPHASLEKLSQNNLLSNSTHFKNTTNSKNNQTQNTIYIVKDFQINDFAVYSGQMMNGMQHGKGIQIWKDGAKYDGEWYEGKASGFGTFYHTDGDVYKGQWKDDKANGKGIYISSDGVQYDGSWVDDFQDGYGIETWKDGSVYKGSYKKGK